MKEITFFEYASFIQEITLDNETFRFVINWNSRGSFFSLTITDVEETVLVAGIKLLLNAEPFHIHPDRSLPPGQLWVVDTTESGEDIGRDDFTNGRLKLIYVTEEELAS